MVVEDDDDDDAEEDEYIDINKFARSVINELQSPVEPAPIDAAPSSIPIDQQQHPDDRWNDLKEMFTKLEEDLNSDPSYAAANSGGMATENLYDDLLDHNNSPLPPTPPSRRRPTRPTAPPPRITGYVPHKQMTTMPAPSPQSYIPHKKMSVGTSPMRPPQSHSVASSPMPQPQVKQHGTQMDHDLQTHNKIRSVYEDFCKGKTNTRHTTHRIMDIVHQVAKDNIR